MKTEIKGIKEIKILVDAFYERLLKDDRISFYFNNVHWEQHLPVMYQFWENTLFYTGTYNGNPMVSHQRLHDQQPFTEEHFNIWLTHFLETVDELFEGEKAELAKQRATSIATIMKIKLIYPRG